MDVPRLAGALEEALRDVTFAYILGSAAHKERVEAHSDLDRAVFLDSPQSEGSRFHEVDKARSAKPNDDVRRTGGESVDIGVSDGDRSAGERVLSLYRRAQEVCETVVGAVRCDVGFLNRSEPVYRYETLKGTLLFCRDQETWLRFYSLTCREYEHQMVHCDRQRRYRLETRR